MSLCETSVVEDGLAALQWLYAWVQTSETHELIIYILFTIFFSPFTPKNSDCQSTKEASYCLNFCDLGRW